MARALQHLGRRDRLAAAYRVRQREHALVGVVQRGGGIGRRAWLCKRTTFTPRQTSIGSLFAQWLSGSVAHGPYAAHRKRLRVPTRDGPSRTQRCARGITITRRTARQPAAARAAACRAADGSSTQWARTSRKVVRVGQQVRQEPIRGDRLREGAARSAHDLHRTACVCDANHGSRAAHHVRHARALARRRRRRVLPRPLELLRSGGGATEGGHTQPPADAAAVARGGPEMVRHDLACRLDGGVGLTLLVSKEAEEPANPQSHKCRGRQCASAPCVDAVLGYHGA